MKCNHCGRDAIYSPIKNGLKVGLCEKHLVEYAFKEKGLKDKEQIKELLRKNDVDEEKIEKILPD